MDKTRVAPMWQRIFCGLLCMGGAVALPLNGIHGVYQGWRGVFAIVGAVGGTYLFGCIALRGRLPGKRPGTGFVRFRHARPRGKA